MLPNIMTDYPYHFVGRDTISATYGVFASTDIGMFREPLDNPGSYLQRVTNGPNAGLYFLREAPPIKDSTEVWLHPALLNQGPPLARIWYADQDGGRFITGAGDTLVACNAAGVKRLRDLAAVHEGVRRQPSSHFGVLASVVSSSGLVSSMERSLSTDSVSLVQGLSDIVTVVTDTIRAAQFRFDNVDKVRIFGTGGRSTGALGCSVFYRVSLARRTP